MKIFHSGDWHIGNFKGPEKDGINLRSLDTKHCLEALAERAEKENPELVLVPGDIFHTGKTWSDRCCDEVVTAMEIISRLAAAAGQVVVMRGTPNHDGEGPFKVLLKHFFGFRNVHIVVNPEVIQTEYADVAALPGFDRGVYRAKFPGLGKEEENEIFSQELGKIVLGLRAQCRADRPAILMAHYTVPGCNTESGQSQLLTQFEPIVPSEALDAAAYDLVALGHIHRPQLVSGFENVYYSGSINANNFNDEGQERGFWIHSFKESALGQEGMVLTDSEFVKTPYREFITLKFANSDVEAVIYNRIDELAMNRWRFNGAVIGKIVRVLYECTAEKKKAFHTAVLEKTLYEDGAFWVAGINPERVEAYADRTDLSQETDPEANLKLYLLEKEMKETDIERLLLKSRPVITEAMAAETGAAFSGMFVPVEIEVKNYRAYAEEKFSFEDIRFCTINGQNGAGKSSLFMDAMIDCIYEEPREGKSTSVKVPWLRNEDKVRSGYIMFTFLIGSKTYRITRTRAKSGKGTLNLAQMVDGVWEDRSCEKFNDTQAAIEQLIGVDSMTFKSCALIMQDQYGLFLQAKKEERMVILSNLLGLGIYGRMEDIARDMAAEYNRMINGKKQSIKVQSQNIMASGKPEEELDQAKERLCLIETQEKAMELELQKANLLLGNAKAAAERYQSLMDDISVLDSRKQAAEKAKVSVDMLLSACDTELAEESMITGHAARYRQLADREKELAVATAVYEARQKESENLDSQIRSITREIEEYKTLQAGYRKHLEGLVSEEDKALVMEKVQEYLEKKMQLDSMYADSQEAARLSDKRSQRSYALDSKKAYFNECERSLLVEKASLKKRTELLKDSGCMDLEKASCRFLADAVQAGKELETFPLRMETLMSEKETALASLQKEVEDVDAEIRELNFSQEKLDALRKECTGLKVYTEKLKEIERCEGESALIQAQMDHVQLNTAKAEERLQELKLQAQRANVEKEKHSQSYQEYEAAIKEMKGLESWVQREKALPVTKEKRANAAERSEELAKEILVFQEELEDKLERARTEKELADSYGIFDRKAIEIQSEMDRHSRDAKKLQTEIGSLEQKIREIRRIRQDIAVMQEEISELAEDAADYETLKLSFSQDGIPHQIIRTILPKLSATANNILSQMTGGQLGVEFITEKVQKSNNKKEVATLDIFIEEYGKGSLPYLSKSGGEKVKSSLSVILALAEIKATTAGIQFGMLFIDEPPFLDADGIQAYCDALETIRERYGDIKIMAITHDPTMKARFPQNLDVVRTEGGSRIIY